MFRLSGVLVVDAAENNKRQRFRSGMLVDCSAKKVDEHSLWSEIHLDNK
jgi:hypothetical protein